MSQLTPNTPQKAWDLAVQKAKKELRPNGVAQLLRVRDYDACLRELQSKNNKFSRKWPRLKAVVGPILDFLRTFDKAVATCCQSKAEVACLVWGGVQMVLTVAAKYSDCARRVSDMLEQLTRSMPRFEDYIGHFPTNDRLHLRLVSVYETFVIFCARAFRFLDSRFFTGIVKATWSSLDGTFTNAVESIKESKSDMESEARAANIAIGFDREAAAERRHQAVMAIIPTALRPSNLLESTAVVPYPRNSAFVGRAKELERMHSYLNTSMSGEDAEPNVVAIRGIGGVGKSQLALEYLFRNKQDYKGSFWIRSEDTAIIQQDFAQINMSLDTGDADAATADLNKAVTTVKRWLSATTEKWLLVFDNVRSAADVQGYLPISGRGSVVITTRDRDIADGLSQWIRTIEIDGLQEIDATSLLHQIDPGIPTGDLSRRIVDDLGGLPLAICQMGSYIRQTKCTVDQFYDILQSRSESLYSDTASMMTLQYSMTLAQCCDMSIELLSNDEVYLLGVIAFFHADEVPEELIIHGCEKIPRMSHLADTLNWNDAVRTLTKHSLVTASQSGSRRSLRVHRVVKRRAIHVLEAAPPSSEMAFHDAAILLDGMFPRRPADGGTMTRRWADCELWLPHVLSLRKASAMLGRAPGDVPREYVDVLCNCAWYMWERGAEHAFEFAAGVVDVCKEALRDDDPLGSDAYTIIGALKIVRFKLKRECVEAFQEALNIRERYMAKTAQPSLDEQRMIANVYNNAGVGRLVMEEYPEAMVLFQKSLGLKYTLGDENTIPYDIGVGLYNICRIQMAQGLIEEAKENAKKALDLAEGHNGPEDFRTNQFRFTYADLLVASGEVEEGLGVHEHTLDIRKRVMGDENNDTGVSYYGLTCLYQQLGRLGDAATSIENAIMVFTHVSGAEDRLARSYFRKHLILKERGQDAESEEALTSARGYRQVLVGNCDGNETMKDYDLLVSYYNK